jgi:hypothetical protein
LQDPCRSINKICAVIPVKVFILYAREFQHTNTVFLPAQACSKRTSHVLTGFAISFRKLNF